MIITHFPHLFNNTGKEFIEAADALARIKNGTSKELIEKIRTIKNKDARNELKKKLPCFCFGGKFDARKKDHLIEKSGLIVLDFDSVTNLEEFKTTLSNDPYTFACFISPSGNGLKAIIKVDPNGNHEKQYDALKQKYPTADASGRDISRVCFSSYDPDLYSNIGSLVWYEEKVSPAPYIPQKVYNPNSEDETVRKLLKWWDNKFPPVEGSRNRHLFILGCSLLEFGIQDVYPILLNNSNGLQEKEVRTITGSATRHVESQGGFASKAFEEKQADNRVNIEDTITEKVKITSGGSKEIKEVEINIKNPSYIDVANVIKLLGYNVTYNTIKAHTELNSSPLDNQSTIWGEVDLWFKQKGKKTAIPKELLKEALKVNKKYNPLKDFYEKQEWDGKPRLLQFMSLFEDKYGQSKEYFLYFLLGSIEKLYNPHFQNPVLTLEGAPGIGKGTAVTALASPFTNGYFKPSSSYDPNRNDDKIAQTRYYIWEWGEATGLSKQDVSAMKEGLTATEQSFRRPYAENPEVQPCIANFIMTKNPGAFFGDQAMRRRFNILYLTKVDLDKLIKISTNKAYMKQIWLEAYKLWQEDAKKKWIYSIDKELKDKSMDEAVERPAFYDILDKILTRTDNTDQYVTNVDLIQAINSTSIKFQDNRTSILKLVQYMREEQNSEKTAKKIDGKTQRVYQGFVIENVEENNKYNRPY